MFLRTCGANPYGGLGPSGFVLWGFEWRVHAEGARACAVVASGKNLCEFYGRGGPVVCLGFGQTPLEYRRKVAATPRCCFPCVCLNT